MPMGMYGFHRGSGCVFGCDCRTFLPIDTVYMHMYMYISVAIAVGLAMYGSCSGSVYGCGCSCLDCLSIDTLLRAYIPYYDFLISCFVVIS